MRLLVGSDIDDRGGEGGADGGADGGNTLGWVLFFRTSEGVLCRTLMCVFEAASYVMAVCRQVSVLC